MMLEDIAQHAHQRIMDNGGVTINLQGHEPDSGYAFSPYPELERVLPHHAVTPDTVHQYLTDNQQALSMPGNHLGAWHDQQSGNVFLDVSHVGPAHPDTIKDAAKANQLAVFDLSNFNEIPTGVERDRSVTTSWVLSDMIADEDDAVSVIGQPAYDEWQFSPEAQNGHWEADDVIEWARERKLATEADYVAEHKSGIHDGDPVPAYCPLCSDDAFKLDSPEDSHSYTREGSTRLNSTFHLGGEWQVVPNSGGSIKPAPPGTMCSFHPYQPAVAIGGFAAMCPRCLTSYEHAKINTAPDMRIVPEHQLAKTAWELPEQYGWLGPQSLEEHALVSPPHLDQFVKCPGCGAYTKMPLGSCPHCGYQESAHQSPNPSLTRGETMPDIGDNAPRVGGGSLPSVAHLAVADVPAGGDPFIDDLDSQDNGHSTEADPTAIEPDSDESSEWDLGQWEDEGGRTAAAMFTVLNADGHQVGAYDNAVHCMEAAQDMANQGMHEIGDFYTSVDPDGQELGSWKSTPQGAERMVEGSLRTSSESLSQTARHPRPAIHSGAPARELSVSLGLDGWDALPHTAPVVEQGPDQSVREPLTDNRPSCKEFLSSNSIREHSERASDQSKVFSTNQDGISPCRRCWGKRTILEPGTDKIIWCNLCGGTGVHSGPISDPDIRAIHYQPDPNVNPEDHRLMYHRPINDPRIGSHSDGTAGWDSERLAAGWNTFTPGWDHSDLKDYPDQMPDFNITPGNPNLSLYRYVHVKHNDPQIDRLMEEGNHEEALHRMLPHIGGDREPDWAGHSLKNLGMHWTHDPSLVRFMSNHDSHGAGAHGVILRADHPGTEHTMSWNDPEDAKFLHNTVFGGPTAGVHPEVAVRPDTPMNVNAAYIMDDQDKMNKVPIRWGHFAGSHIDRTADETYPDQDNSHWDNLSRNWKVGLAPRVVQVNHGYAGGPGQASWVSLPGRHEFHVFPPGIVTDPDYEIGSGQFLKGDHELDDLVPYPYQKAKGWGWQNAFGKVADFGVPSRGRSPDGTVPQLPLGPTHNTCPKCGAQWTDPSVPGDDEQGSECPKCGYDIPWDGAEVMEGWHNPYQWAQEQNWTWDPQNMHEDDGWGPRNYGHVDERYSAWSILGSPFDGTDLSGTPGITVKPEVKPDHLKAEDGEGAFQEVAIKEPKTAAPYGNLPQDIPDTVKLVNGGQTITHAYNARPETEAEPWTPGAYGKAVFRTTPQGHEFHIWKTDELGGWPHHGAIGRGHRHMLDTVSQSPGYEIDPKGGLNRIYDTGYDHLIPHPFYHAEEDTDWDATDFQSKTAKETLPQRQRRWESLLDAYPDNSKVLAATPEGYTINRLRSFGDVARTGIHMNNCWRGLESYSDPSRLIDPTKSLQRHTLNDENGHPQVAFLTKSYHDAPTLVHEALGIRNKPPRPEHLQAVQNWAADNGYDYVEANYENPILQGQIGEGVPAGRQASWEVVATDGYYYHAAPTTERDRIQAHGLIPAKPGLNENWWINKGKPTPGIAKQPPGVYVVEHPDELPGYVTQQADVWRIPKSQVTSIMPDKHTRGWAIQHAVHPELHQPWEGSELQQIYQGQDEWDKGLMPADSDWQFAHGYDAKEQGWPMDTNKLFRQHGVGMPNHIIGSSPHSLVWEPGWPGKGIYHNGELTTWGTNSNDSHKGWPHHVHMWGQRYPGKPWPGLNDPNTMFLNIDPEGEVRESHPFQGEYPEEIHQIDPRLKKEGEFSWANEFM